MAGLMKKLYTPLVFDVLMAAAGLVSFAALILSTGKGAPAIAPVAEPVIKGAALAGAVVAAVLIAVGTTRMDQQLADDFLFHSIAKSALIAQMAFFFTATLWHVLFAASMGSLSFYTMIAVAAAALSLSWFYTRWRGTRA